jgi:membrane-bound lytic murein transglycosylase D
MKRFFQYSATLLLLFSQILFASESLELKAIDIDVPEEELISYYKNQYLSDSAKRWLEEIMTNAAEYRPFILQELKEQDAPLCLQYLPVIESNYKITALSKSGASGLWQFMKNSIAPFNIHVNEWMDERRDPWLSTRAAIQKLKENYSYFQDWHLALAAYNAGLGGISRLMQSYKTNNYWDLAKKGALTTETKHYVPKFLAIAEILENHEYYGLDFPNPEVREHKSLDFVEIPIKKAVSLQILAEKIEVSEKELIYYNPSLYYGISPMDTSYRLRVSQDSAEKTLALLNDESLPLIQYSMYKIKSGDTLYALALHYGVSVDSIQKLNSLKTSKIIIGQNLLIPSIKNVGEYAGSKPAEAIAYDGSYVVKKSDTLWSISLAYNVQVEQLAEENNMLVSDILREGFILKVPIRN